MQEPEKGLALVPLLFLFAPEREPILYGILASPPCTCTPLKSLRWWSQLLSLFYGFLPSKQLKNKRRRKERIKAWIFFWSLSQTKDYPPQSRGQRPTTRRPTARRSKELADGERSSPCSLSWHVAVESSMLQLKDLLQPLKLRFQGNPKVMKKRDWPLELSFFFLSYITKKESGDSTFQLALSIGDYYGIEISRTDEGSRGTYRSLFSFVSLLIKYLSRRRWKKQGPRWNFYLWKRSFTRKMSVQFLVQNWVVRKVSIETLRSFFSPF